MSVGAVSDLNQWKRLFFESVGLSTPDGRPLYDYRLSEQQFQSLEVALREKTSPLKSLDYLSQTCSAFSPLFVLYASEWWRRRYKGERLSWEPILRDLHAEEKGWNAVNRGEVVSQGLRYWKFRVIKSGGLKYLGAIAVQGGLPMQLLAEARGRLGGILRRVLKLAAYGAEFQQILGWVESLEEDLPKSYRREEIFVLLAEVIDTVLQLKNEAQLTASSEAINILNLNIPGWRARFPLPVEDENIQGLIENLIRDVADQRSEKPSKNITLQRWLNNTSEAIWSLRSSIDMPDNLDEGSIRKIFSLTEEINLTRSFEVVLNAGTNQQTYAVRKVAGQSSYRIERSPKELHGALVTVEHTISLRNSEGQIWHAALRKGETLDCNIPWIFGSDQEPSLNLIRQGYGAVAVEKALVAIPPGSSIQAAEGGCCEMVAFLDDPEREIYLVSGTVSVKNSDGIKSVIRTGRTDACDESYQWHGDRVWIDFLKPGVAFRSKPNLSILRGEESEQRIPDKDVSWSNRDGVYGPIRACYEKNGGLRYQSKMVLLPHNASVEYLPQSTSKGIIRFNHWMLAGATLIGESEVEIQVQLEGNNVSLICSSRREIAPEWMELSLVWGGNTDTAKIRLPFPAEGARAFDGCGGCLANNSWLSINHLIGVRLVSLCRSHIPVETVFRVHHTTQRENEHELRRRIRPIPGTSRLEIRVLDYIGDIQQLLAADELLDAWVEVGLYIGNQPAVTVRVSRYTCRLARLIPNVLITNEHLAGINSDQLEALPVCALRLEHPEEEPIRLPCLKSQGVANGAWHFDPVNRAPGAWLIYPGKESILAFRPTLWLVDGDSQAKTPLADVLAIEDRDIRAGAIVELIASMAADFCHPSWQDLEQFAAQLGHLPLATLDVWRNLAHSPSAMASLALRIGGLPISFLQRFTQELPFLWEIVPIRAWLNACNQLQRQAKAWFGEELGQSQFKLHLEKQKKHLVDLNPSLGYLLSAVTNRDLSGSKSGLDAWLMGQLFDRENGKLNMLRTSHRSENWPKDFSSLKSVIDRVRKDQTFSHLFPHTEFGIRDEFVCANIPILLATQVATNNTGIWFSQPEYLYNLRTYMAFDREWFSDAFDITIARCLATNVLTN